MDLDEVLAVLDALDASGCRAWLTGGWGVDALAGRQTREHRDVDLAIDAATEAEALDVLGRLGYGVALDWRPVRLELEASCARRVDLHPVVLDASGNGVQADHDGHFFTYPAECLVVGRLAGRPVRCLSIAKQRELHAGYEPRPVDRLDLAVLDELTRASASTSTAVRSP